MGERASGLAVARKARAHHADSAARRARWLDCSGITRSLDSAQEVLATADSLLDYPERARDVAEPAHGSDSATLVLERTRASRSTASGSALSREEGTAGRILNDDALRRGLEELRRQLARTAADVGKRSGALLAVLSRGYPEGRSRPA